MLNVEHGGKKYRIYFKYGKEVIVPKMNKSGTRVIKTVVRRVTEAKLAVDGAVCEIVGETQCSPKDKFNKKVGRKNALADLMKKMPNKDLRQLVWDKFFQLNPHR